MSQDVGKLRCRIAQVSLYKYFCFLDSARKTEKYVKIRKNKLELLKIKLPKELLHISIRASLCV
jgi:hypothetical protein